MRKVILSFFLTFSLAILCFSLADDDGYLYIMQPTQTMKGLVNTIYYKMAQKAISEKDSSGTGTVNSSGTGLNLLLISQMNEGYVKELLQMYADASEGKITKSEYHAPFELYLGMHLTEKATYAGTKIPYFHFPIKGKEIIWNKTYNGLSAEQMTLAGFDSSALAKLNSGALGGDSVPMQILSSTGSRDVYMANVSSSNNKGRTSFDRHYLPDQLGYVDSEYSQTYKILGLDKKKDIDYVDRIAVSANTSTFHNRGEDGILRGAFGIKYELNKHGISSNFINVTRRNAYTKLKKDEFDAAFYALTDAYVNWEKDFREGNKKLRDLTKDDSKGIALALTYHDTSNGEWFYNQAAINYSTGGNKINNVVKAFQTMYPDENWTKDKVIKALNSRVRSSLAEAIKEVNGVSVTSSDTSKIYNTSSDYSDASYYPERGAIFRVTKTKTSAYKKKYSSGEQPFHVNAYDTVAFQLQASCIGILAKGYYPYLLKLAGVNIDTTNPESYTNNYKNNNEWTPSDITWMSQYSVDTSKLTDDRIAVLNQAYKIVQDKTPYCWAGKGDIIHNYQEYVKESGNNWKSLERFLEPYYPFIAVDCSRFIQVAYKKAGFSNIGYETTATIMGNHQWEKISGSSIKPGDIIAHNIGGDGHVVMYVSGKWNGRPIIMEAPETKKLCKIGTRNITSRDNPYRYKNIDKNKRKQN